MKIIGLISDTHGLLRPEATAALAGCAMIVHAGDVGDPAILDRLAKIAPLWAVRGNTDYGPILDRLPGSHLVDLLSPTGGVTPHHSGAHCLAYVHHGHRELDVDPATVGVRLVVSGHTHLPSVAEAADGVLFVNPGSAGPRRPGTPVTLGVLEVAADGALGSVRILDLI